MTSANNFDLNYLAENQPSMCIPRAFDNVDERLVRDIFEQLDLGQVSHIDIIERRTEKGEKYKRVFIHFTRWFWNDEACTARRRLIDGKDIKVVYNTPWFWKISANRWSNNSNNNSNVSNAIHEDIRRNVRRGGPRIEFDDDNRQVNDRHTNNRHVNEARVHDNRHVNEARHNDRHVSEARHNDRHVSEARRNDRHNDRKQPIREEKPPVVKTPIVKTEPVLSASEKAEMAQMAIITSTKKRVIVLKKKEPVVKPKIELELEEGEIV
jgi:hypothetical protein